MFSSFPETSKLFVHSIYFSTLPVCMQNAFWLFAVLCVVVVAPLKLSVLCTNGKMDSQTESQQQPRSVGLAPITVFDS